MRLLSVLVVLSIMGVCQYAVTAPFPGIEVLFLRGDATNDLVVDMSDPMYIQNWLYHGGSAPSCLEAADANDDGQVNLSDSSYLYSFLFQGGPRPPQPFPACGNDGTQDGLSCKSNACD